MRSVVLGLFGVLWISGLAHASNLDFVGTWKLDRDASSNTDELMKAQEIPWIIRSTIGSTAIVQTISPLDEQGLSVAAHLPIGKITREFWPDGVERTETTRRGTFQVRSHWRSPEQLVTESTGEGRVSVETRRLENGALYVDVEVRSDAGITHGIQVFRKVE